MIKFMNFIIQNLITYLILYKYATIFIIAFAAALVVPIPSGSILMAASAFANIGYFNIFLVIILSIAGNILGDNIGYWFARKYGRDVLSHIGFRKLLESDNFKNIETKFSRHPGFIVFASRFEVLSTLSVNLLSGLSKTSYKKYFLYESLGSVAQICMYSTIGYLFADSWELINTTIGKVMIAAVLVLVLGVIFFGRKFIKRIGK